MGGSSAPPRSGATREAPDDGVVSDDPARRVVERRLYLAGDILGQIHLRAELADLVRVDDAAVDPEELVHLGPLVRGDDPAVEWARVRWPCWEKRRLKSRSAPGLRRA
jgi:hypothetical protein